MAEVVSSAGQEKQRREFRADLRNFFKLCAVASVLVIYLLVYGAFQYHQFSRLADMGFPPYWIFYVLPWSVALATIAVAAAIVLRMRGRKVVITRQAVEVHVGKTVYRTNWENLSFTPPRPDRKRFRSALLSDGAYYERIDEFFYPGFELLIEVLARAKRHARDSYEA